ncbi:hypothetical protein QR721_12825 [Aciduricibacillus chroicocephali]|uniref:Bacterial toxin 50 domain-containing protein n=1 Tax=Aciduricibacillus chroicocephali TaxID=3054939 RepID=A0ABY9KUD1_9BACI|nr:hypothetical protein QR721_12825 [Bacillaceae bacterium 44XB]
MKKVAEENQMSASEEAIRQYLLSGVKKDPSEFEADGFTVKSSLTDSQSAMIANDTRVGINGGYFNMLGGIVTYGVPKAAMATGEFFFGDIVKMVHPDSTMKDRSTAAIFTFVKPAKVLPKLQLDKARKLVGKGTGKYNTDTMKHIYHGEINKRGKAVGYHHESMMGGKIIPGTEKIPDKNGVL